MPDPAAAAPLAKVKFRHPGTGEEAEGHVHTSGQHGATVVAGDGATHKVPHGHYMHAPADGADAGDQPADDGPDAAAVKQHATQHLQLGPTAPLAIYGAICLLAMGGVSHPHDLTGADVSIHGSTALIHRDRRRVTDPGLVAVLSHLAGPAGDGPLFQLDGKPVDHAAVDAYAARFGGDAPAGPPAPAPLAKASMAAMAFKPARDPDSTWLVGGFECEYRRQAPGVGLLTLRKGTLQIPLHELVGNQFDARRTADRYVAILQAGHMPPRGIMRVDGR